MTWFTKRRRAQTTNDYETWIMGGVSPTLNSFDNTGDSRPTVLIATDVTVFQPGAASRLGGHIWENVTPTLRAEAHRGDNEPHIVQGEAMHVRRLTPLECERLMGWPDNHTKPRADGKTNSDTNRYKMCGNGVASPVATWIANQINNI